MKAIVKLTLAYVAFFIGALLLLIHEFIVRSLSPRFVLPIFLVAAYGLTVVFVGVAFRRTRTAQSRTVPIGGPFDPATRKQRLFAVRAGKMWVVLLVFALVAGLTRANAFPLWETLVAVAINLSITATIISVVVRLQKSLK
jgi:hypothetical protein